MQTCNLCGQTMRKAHRIVDGKRICTSCYKRECKPTKCTACGKNIRVPDWARERLCKYCRVDRTCIRCGKIPKTFGRVTQDGGVCPSCVKYFDPPKICSICGKETYHAGKALKYGITEPACHSCISQKAGHRTCICCGKHRAVYARSESGKPVCKRCATQKGPFVCPKCGQEGRPHSKSMCEECYWVHKFDVLSQELAVKLSDNLRGHFEGFCVQRRDENPQVAYVKLEFHFEFFNKVETFVGGGLDSKDLLDEIGADALRRYMIPYNYLINRGVLPAVSQDDIDRQVGCRNQQRILDKYGGCWFDAALRRYYKYLLDIEGKYRKVNPADQRCGYKPRTITGHLRAAGRFLAGLELDGTIIQAARNDPDIVLRKLCEDDFYSFWQKHPGYKASILTFVRWLNYDGQRFRRLELENNTKAVSQLWLGEEEIGHLVQVWLDPRYHARDGFMCLLMGLYGQKSCKVCSLLRRDLWQSRQGRYVIALGEQPLELPVQMCAVIDAYLAQRDNGKQAQSIYLFPARRSLKRPITTAAFTYVLQKYGVDANMLYATSFFRFFASAEIRIPKIIAMTTGANIITALKYYNLYQALAYQRQ